MYVRLRCTLFTCVRTVGIQPAPSYWGHLEHVYQYFFPSRFVETTSASSRGSLAATSALLTEAFRLSSWGGTELTASSSSSEVSEWSSSSPRGAFVGVGAANVAWLASALDTWKRNKNFSASHDHYVYM